MVLSKLKDVVANGARLGVNHTPVVLVVEDDVDQLDMLAEIVLDEVRSLLHKSDSSTIQQQVLRSIKVVKVTNAAQLAKSLVAFENIVLAILDCNIPDNLGERPHDQFVIENHRITGQHKSVDLVIEKSPEADLVLISSMKRFQRTVLKYYKNHRAMQLKFFDKSDAVNLKSIVRSSLTKFAQGTKFRTAG